jgi:UDP:flavonoid glycosyltransferase YjiC (YdhE family)
MRILLCSLGSHGDIHPSLALGRELLHHGHAVTFATSSYYRDLIERHGIAFAPIRPEAPVDDPNPFLALFGFEDRQSAREMRATSRTTQVFWWAVKADTDVEAVVRSQAILDARRRCLEFYNRSKTRLRMPII